MSQFYIGKGIFKWLLLSLMILDMLLFNYVFCYVFFSLVIFLLSLSVLERFLQHVEASQCFYITYKQRQRGVSVGIPF